MKTESIEIGGEGIKSILKKYKPEQAFAEYIWNGFDAQAKEVRIEFEEVNNLGGLAKISITDDGYGIPQEVLNQKFKPFFESEKAGEDNRHRSLTHGKNGIGRLTFFTFATRAKWTTRYKKEGDVFEYDIEITSQNLKKYSGSSSELRKVSESLVGTTVTFEGINQLTKDYFLGPITDYLKQEFGWFLELFKARGLSIKIDGKSLDYSTIIGERDSAILIHKESNTSFGVEFIRWNQGLQNEYSRYYLVDSNDNEIWKDTTKLNNKGDSFFHSIYIKSPYFSDFVYNEKQGEGQQTLIGKSKNDTEYKFLEEEITHYLRKKRKPFLKEFANQLVIQYENDGIIPEFNKDDWEQSKKLELEEVVKGLYQVQPKIFSASSVEQKKTFVHFLNALLGSDERDQILAIINEIVDLDFEEREDLLKLLRSTKLSGVIRTIKLIANRYEVVDQLKQLVFNEELKANERDHIQKMVDENYWLFGEQFHLVTSTEAKFEKALQKYVYILTGKDEKTTIDHPDKNKEMDIFMCRQNKLAESIENVVIELKSPTVHLGEKEVSQVKKYMNVILSQDQFNGDKTYWDFILVGNRFDTSNFIDGEIKNSEHHGERKNGLIFKNDKYRIYVKKWSDVFTDFECRHKFLEEKLKLQRDALSREYTSTDEIISDRL